MPSHGKTDQNEINKFAYVWIYMAYMLKFKFQLIPA